jgi:hypothetical protein
MYLETVVILRLIDTLARFGISCIYLGAVQTSRWSSKSIIENLVIKLAEF